MIDGVLGSAEWDSGITTSMSDGSVLHWMESEGTLYVALESDSIGAVNLAIATPDEIWILHSSAALGSALYVPGNSTWELVHGYSWCCRSATDETARLELLADENWQANIGFTGDDGVVEYQVTMPWDHASLAVSLVTESNQPAYWPLDLSDEARGQLIGARSTGLDFDLNAWVTVVPAN